MDYCMGQAELPRLGIVRKDIQKGRKRKKQNLISFQSFYWYLIEVIQTLDSYTDVPALISFLTGPACIVRSFFPSWILFFHQPKGVTGPGGHVSQVDRGRQRDGGHA